MAPLTFLQQTSKALELATVAEHRSWTAFLEGDKPEAERREAEADWMYSVAEEARQRRISGLNHLDWHNA